VRPVPNSGQALARLDQKYVQGHQCGQHTWLKYSQQEIRCYLGWSNSGCVLGHNVVSGGVIAHSTHALFTITHVWCMPHKTEHAAAEVARLAASGSQVNGMLRCRQLTDNNAPATQVSSQVWELRRCSSIHHAHMPARYGARKILSQKWLRRNRMRACNVLGQLKRMCTCWIRTMARFGDCCNEVLMRDFNRKPIINAALGYLCKICS
jgi:hypothetical protein